MAGVDMQVGGVIRNLKLNRGFLILSDCVLPVTQKVYALYVYLMLSYIFHKVVKCDMILKAKCW